MAAGEGVDRVNIAVARGAERRSVCFAGDGSWGLLADVAEEDTSVTRSQLVGGMDVCVACCA